MIVCVDVDYRESCGVAALVAIPKWDSDTDAATLVVRIEGAPPPYVPGAFYRRELPYLTRVIDAARDRGIRPTVVVVDGYAWLGPSVKGLGAHLSEALAGTPVIGVAKTPYRASAPVTVEVIRGGSTTPLFVTAAGIDTKEAGAHVQVMHGAHRIPTMLRRVDRAAREG